MHLRFIGTGADDWTLQMQGNKEYRRKTSLLINDNLLIDSGVDFDEFKRTFNIENAFDNVKTILISHSHKDHFNLDNLKKISSHNKTDIIGNRQIKTDDAHFPVQIIMPFETVTVKGYEITALPANHATADNEEICYNYLIQNNGKTFFYGLDSAWILTKTYRFLKNYVLDGAVFDCTVGRQKNDYRFFEHNSINMLFSITKSLKTNKIITDNTKIIASHFSKWLHKNQETLAKYLSIYNIIAAYDNFTVEI